MSLRFCHFHSGLRESLVATERLPWSDGKRNDVIAIKSIDQACEMLL
jgi:hypothetical protein